MQLANGGFSYWPHSRKEYGWGSLYAIHFLVEADRAGYDVPEARLKAALTYTAALLTSNTRTPDPTNRAWSDYMTRRATACRILAVAGTPHHGWMERLREIAGDLDTTSVANLAAAFTTNGRRDIAAQLLELPGLDNTGTTLCQTGNALNSGTRNLALLLSAWLDINPHAPIIPGLVSRLNKRQSKNGRWHNTQNNAVALMALGRYAQLLNDQDTTFKASLTSTTNTHAFDDHHPLHITHENGSEETFVVKNEGPGPVYLHWNSSGVPRPSATKTANIDNQIRVRRTLLDADQHAVNPQLLQQGKLYVIRISVDTLGERIDNIVIEDLLPAGLEVENARLKTSALLPWVRNRQTLPVRHLELRDDRVLIFADPLQGDRDYYYAVRAVTRGSFVAPAISAECMYDSAIHSTHGQSSTTIH